MADSKHLILTIVGILIILLGLASIVLSFHKPPNTTAPPSPPITNHGG